MRFLYLLIPYLTLISAHQQQQQEFNRIFITGHAQGTTYQVLYYAPDTMVSKTQIDSMLRRIDQSLSLYQPGSRINRFNNSKRGVKIDEHLRIVVQKGIETFQTTNGIFDITVHPLVQAWGFGVKKSNTIPDSAQINAILQCVGSNLIRLDRKRLRKIKPCVKIDLNGIAQGYSVDLLASFLEKNGVNNYLVEIGGEIRVKGKKMPGHEKMKIGIESPPQSIFAQAGLQQIVELDSGAITTSGSYRQYYESDGKKISHIIDPRTGYTANNELISVTVYAPDAMTADAYDNALMVMGLSRALQFVEQRNDLAAYFIYRKQDGQVADTACSQFNQLLKR